MGEGRIIIRYMANYKNNGLAEMTRLAKALADGNRLRVLLFLGQAELCVCQLMELLGLAPSTVSKHLSVLAQAGLVVCRKIGLWHYYRLPGPEAPAPVRRAVQWVQQALAGDPQMQAEIRRLRAVLKQDKKTLCFRYHR